MPYDNSPPPPNFGRKVQEYKPNSAMTHDELEDMARHQRFILGCEDRTILLLLIRQLEFHADPIMRLDPTFLGGNVLLTPELAERMVSILKALK